MLFGRNERIIHSELYMCTLRKYPERITYLNFFRKDYSDCVGNFFFLGGGAAGDLFFSVLLLYVLDDLPSRTSRTLEDKDNNFRRNVKFPFLTGLAAYHRGKKILLYLFVREYSDVCPFPTLSYN